MSRYAAPFEDAVTSGLLTVGHVTRGASKRAKVYDITIGHGGTPADNQVEWSLRRHTTAPTSTGVTPVALDEADAASITTAGENATIEPTYAGVNLLHLRLNQRASYRWVAAPGGELVIPDTANNGIGVQALDDVSSYTGTANVTVHFEE